MMVHARCNFGAMVGAILVLCVPGVGLASGVFCDGDCDGDVDLGDLNEFVQCLGGPDPGVPPSQGCLEVFDADSNGAVDLCDFGGFQWQFTGPAEVVPQAASCNEECPSDSEPIWRLYQVSDPGGLEPPPCVPSQLSPGELICVLDDGAFEGCPDISELSWFDGEPRCSMGATPITAAGVPCLASAIPPEYQDAPFNGERFFRLVSPHTLYNQVLEQIREGVDAGDLPQETLDYFIKNKKTLSQNMDVLLEATTITTVEEVDSGRVAERASEGRTTGGVVTGRGWVGKSAIGITIARFNITVAYLWLPANPPCEFINCISYIDNFVATGNILLGTFRGHELTRYGRGCWPESLDCPAPSGCVSPGRTCFCDWGQYMFIAGSECGEYYVTWKQKLSFITLASGTTTTQQICTPCAQGTSPW